MPYQTKFELSLFEDLLASSLHPTTVEETLKTTEAVRVWMRGMLGKMAGELDAVFT
jgi:hypothetical protein